MLRIDGSGKKLVRLEKSALANADHWERHLQEMICAEPDAFCEEIGESLWVIGQEVRPSEAIPDRVDILALDESGHCVVIELKRGSHKLQLLQAISYAGMVSRWSGESFVETLAKNYHQPLDDARSDIEQHVGSDISALNQAQRILLIAEDFDPALLVATEWLHENYGVDIRCYRLQLSQENGTEYLTCTCIYPPIEIATLTRGANVGAGQTSSSWTSWDSALEAVENPAVKDFFRAELAKSRGEPRLPYRELIYRVAGKRRFWLSCRKKYAYVWQGGRFDGDSEYWQKALSEPDHVRQVKDDGAMRFRLTTASDFAAFGSAMNGDLAKIKFAESDDVQQPSGDE